jgi:hypothetical protein
MGELCSYGYLYPHTFSWQRKQRTGETVIYLRLSEIIQSQIAPAELEGARLYSRLDQGKQGFSCTGATSTA